MAPSESQVDTPASAHARLTAAFASGVTRPLSFRLEQLRALRRFLSATEADQLAALQSDLRRHERESLLYEVGPVCKDIAYLLRNLRWLARDRLASRDLGAPVVITPSPKGVVLVIGPFNFPVHLLLRPLVNALAAGNAVVLKPSELAPACAAYVARLTAVLDRRVFAVVPGAADTAKELLTFRWDHVMFTGSPRVGRLVLAAVAKHLTPVTLELGGKNPALVSRSASPRVAAETIARARFQNAGQICLAVEYALVEDAIYDEFMSALLRAVKTMFGDDPKQCAHFGRLITSAHWQRVSDMFSKTEGNVLVGGQMDDDDQHYMAPTVVEVQSADDALMQEEIFGPVLVVLRVPSVDAAIAMVNERPTPLALYVYGDKRVARDVISRTRSGSVGVNDVVMQVAAGGSHIGGVGESGMGAYGSQRGFEEFSHMRPVLWSNNTYAKALRFLRSDILATHPGAGTITRHLMCIPFPGSDVPVREKVGRWVGRVFKFSLVVGCAVVAKAVFT